MCFTEKGDWQFLSNSPFPGISSNLAKMKNRRHNNSNLRKKYTLKCLKTAYEKESLSEIIDLIYDFLSPATD